LPARSASDLPTRSLKPHGNARPPHAHRNGVGVPIPRRARSKDWDRHVEHVEALATSSGFIALRDRILGLAVLGAGTRLLDVGAGTGLLALAAAGQVSHVVALDSSGAMCERLEQNRLRLGVENLETLQASATTIPLVEGSVDVVVSNYCFHHLDHSEKETALLEIRRVLRPGGRIVFADMMFDLRIRGRRNRAVVAGVTRRLLRRGPGGIARLARSALRLAVGRGEHPAGAEWWRGALKRTGFVDVSVAALDNEGGIASARRSG
jgi:SAM-dependent methyltransferase